jgi:squalene-hopene/tetraprenyl-beta-curcumene cyclase
MSARGWTGIAAATFTGALLVWNAGGEARSDAPKGPSAQQWDLLVTRAIRYLRTTQAEDGSWSRDKSPGVTGIVVTGLLKSGRVSVEDPMAAKALRYIESLINPKAGHIAGSDPRVQLQNYVTSVNVMALSAANREDRYKKVLGDAADFLKRLQWDEEEGKRPGDDYYGGAGYDSKSRPDLSNTQFFLDALAAAGVPRDDPALRKALVFVGRCQNLKGEHNDQPWAGKINDGSFIYSAAGGGQTKAETLPDGSLVGYGSMTYAGIKSMIYCGVSKDDPRIKKAYEWITKNYTLDANPGMPKVHADWGLFYYYHTLAKCLATMDVEEVVDAAGQRHDWRADLVATLAKRQRPDGSWINVNHWMEADPNLVTGYALMALAYCKPQKD